MSKGISQAEFARQINVKRSRVTQLKQAGRLVLNDDGKVLADESRALIASTKDPSKDGVAERHAKARKNEIEIKDKEEPLPPASAGDAESFNFWKTKNEKLKFQSNFRESQVRDGELLEIQAVKMAVMGSDAVIRNRLESLPDLLAPQLATEDDEHKVRILLIDQIEWLLSELSQDFKKMSA